MIKIKAICAFLLLSVPALADTPLGVDVITAKSTPNTRINVLIGEIIARDTLTASFPAGGRITSVAFEVGDKVKAGAILAQMESVQQSQALRAAEAGLVTAEADYKQAQENLERQTALLERGATTRISKDAADDELNVVEGSLTQARADLDRAQKSLDDTILRATTAATVTARLVEPGQVVGAAQAAFELALGDGLDAVFAVPEAILVQSNDDDKGITLSLLDKPAQPFVGKLRRISPLVDPATGTVEVTLAVSEAPAGTSYGDAVRGMVRFEGGDHIVLPFSAISATADGPAVWVVDPATDTVSLKTVELDRYETGRFILRGGIADGTIIVTRGAQLLYPGRVVKILDPTQ
ncbi:efflux RND transporter periplasmic adaptor subunit [Roseobacter sp. N2S]|uniref:efflux RND transporter periplasmic adaptor subunit n=1 Tax=Roseobacter sp. N2S TaxID=2663844 RepID=UPI002862582B|nr:efflux RND transporter periplasmic adaptor subunit [Roseobacter sp. N2S]MDR6264502.1 RND family efflux transporter MFP subunit [Roseobacter sp. N2S]